MSKLIEKLKSLDKRTSILLGIIAVLLLLTGGLTFAYFTIVITGNEDAEDIVIESANLSLLYVDGPKIELKNAFPGQSVTKTVHVTNTGTYKVAYAIGLVDYINTFINNDITVSYTCTSYENYGGSTQAVSGTCAGLSTEPLESTNDDTITINEGIQIEAGITHELTFTFTFRETGSNQNENQGKKFSGTLNILESGDSFDLTMQILDNGGLPITNANVELHSSKRTGTTNSMGMVTLQNVTVGTHSLKVVDGSNQILLQDTFTLSSASSDSSINEKNVVAQTGKSSVSFIINKSSDTTIASLLKMSDSYISLKSKSISTLSTITHSATLQTDATVAYRFQGASADVNNWVYFNCSNYSGTLDTGKVVSAHDNTKQCEKWRIIGLFEESGDYHLKIVKVNAISVGSAIQWNSVKATDKNNNDWSVSQLQYYLNSAEASGSFNLTGTLETREGYIHSLSSTAQNMLYSAKWYLGNTSYAQPKSTSYSEERGTTVYSGNPTNWTGKVGLIYTSDYEYAPSNCSDNYYRNCRSKNWLYLSGYTWTISPYYHKGSLSNPENYVAVIDDDGDTSNSDVRTTSYNSRPIKVYPTVYLNSNVTLGSGEGTEASPWMLEMN